VCLIGQKIRPPNISFKNKRNIGGLMQLTIAQSSEVISELLQEHGLNKILEMVLNSLLKLEREGFLKESNNKLNKANGYRNRRVAGINKTITLSIPRDRLGYFYPTLLTIIKEQEEEVAKLAFNLYSKGLSTRDVSDIFEELYGDKYSKTTISRFNKGFIKELENWRNRPLERHYPILMIDAIYSKVRRDFSIENEATYTVIALREDLTRDIIALEHIPTESASGWEDLLRSLKKRGVETVDLIVADGLTGLENSVSKVFPDADFQKCVVHLKRYILNRISHKHKSEIAEDLKEIFNISDSSYTKKEGIENMNKFIIKWGRKYKFIRNMKEMKFYYYFTYLDYDYRVRSMIYTTNWIENLNKQFRRVLKIRNSMPSEESVLLLLTKVAYDKVLKLNKYPIYLFKFDKKLCKKRE